ncbi:MAG: ATP synthase F0 subunit B [Pyrinomonadaceae bacterium]
MGNTFLGLAQGSIQLVPDGTLLIHVGLILVMIAVLNRTLFRPINKILQRREMMGEEARDEAVRISASANKRVAEYEAALRKARGDGYREAELARLQGLSESESKLSSTREEIKKLVHMEKLALEDQSDQARRVLAAEAEAVAVEIRNRILKSSRSDG